MTLRRRRVFVLVAAFLSIPLCPIWAADIAAPGIPNFHEVADHIYRGGQPTAEGWLSLSHLGVKTVIDLRRDGEHSVKAEQQAVEAAGMHYVNIPLKGIVAPPDEKIQKALALLEASPEQPVFVHCKQGRDRTGTVIACYRIAYDGWQNQAALREAKSYGMHRMEVGMKRYILGFSAPIQNAVAEAAPSKSLP
jgi:tyrosine-protein phosphatase SIW14